MKILTTVVARSLYAVPFFVFGCFHLYSAPMMAGMVPHILPGAVYWVYLTGVCMIAASIAIVTQKQGALAYYLLAALLFVYIAAVHIPGLMVPAMKQMSMIMALKDVGLMGAALGFAGILRSEKS